MRSQVVWHGPKITRDVHDAAARGLYKWAEHVLEEANRIVPLQEGTLQNTGVASVDEGALRGAVSYDTPYAVKQHEELDYQHPGGRQAKYLETPLNASHAKGLQIVADEIKGVLGGGGPGRQLVSYTSKAGRTSMITQAQAANYSRNRSS